MGAVSADTKSRDGLEDVTRRLHLEFMNLAPRTTPLPTLLLASNAIYYIRTGLNPVALTYLRNI